MFLVNCLILFITLVNIIVHYLRQQHEEQQTNVQRNNSSLLSSSSHQYRRFSLAEIKWATQNFDAGLVIGKGGFGEVYKGVIDNGATTVAIKRLGFWSSQGAPEFLTEIEMLSKFRHSHLVSLIGYCNDHPEMIIVYEYMSGGTLADNLHRRRSHCPLSWIQRLKVCIGAARGLDYLHTGTDIQTRVIHRDVKSTNILLDANCDAKISDFGLSKIGPAEQINTHVSTHVKGTFGYIDPEYLWSHRLTRKSDVYAFGVVMLEVLCGRPAVDRNLEEQWGLAKWAKRCIKEGRLLEIVDPHLNGSFLSDCLEAFARIADQCLHSSSRKRPTMAEVVNRLEYALSLQEDTSFSLGDVEIIDSGKGVRGGAGSAVEPDEKSDANVVQYQTPVTKKMTYVQKVWRFFSTKDPVISAKDPVISAYSSFQSPYLKMFSFAELQVATDNFNAAKKLADGGFSTVYYGKLKDGREVAVKQLYEHNYKRVEQFMNEVEILSRLRHPNLVLLYGCTSHHSRALLLVYEYISNGTVADHLHGDRVKTGLLTWPIRMNIAIKTASALAYLHKFDIIHLDVNTNNILLDENFCVKVADFRVSRLFSNVTHVSTVHQGTPGYVDPEYHQCYELTDKSDVYSFGVVLIELVSSRPAVDIRRDRHEINLSNFALNRIQKCELNELIDPSIGFGSDDRVNRMTTSVVELAFRCLEFDKNMRPTMDEVLVVLKEIHGHGTKDGADSVGRVKSVKPHPSPETEEARLLKNSMS